MKRLIGLLFPLFLTGCVAGVVAGTTAGSIVYDGRGVVTLERDARIFHMIHTAIVRDRRFRNARIEVTSFSQAVLLVGQTRAASLKVLAEKIARKTPNVLRVYNEITIGQPISLAQRAKDTWITGQVRSQMLMRKGLESGSIRVVTENNVVYLMGIVSHEQAFQAMDVARQVTGVARVVKVFRYLR
jgi:osmotically-inducible protein OsmY